MDISFELGWPDHRWVGENILQLYREQNFSEFEYPERLILVNKSDKAIRQLQITTNNDKFLGFDLSPGSEIRLIASPSKGDSSGIWVSGKFDDGQIFENRAVFDVTQIRQSVDYSIVATNDGMNIRTGHGQQPVHWR
jgi:hypothetical protein